ncbi:MAG TPA: sigma-54 dependent transcriptional regulator, partial [Myxococcaceae bacterium]|nr:sigma-54 dependent transcriptional regulator [Myxococcaceae bacterium]
FSPAQIRHAVERVVARRAMAARLFDLEERLGEATPDATLETASPRMQAAIDMLQKAAGHDVSVLLRGESGTGKGVLARALHAFSPRRDRPFAVVNCPTLTDELLASELFGHARGAFTGAVKDQPGRVEAAEGGTLFLDEIGEISPGLQAKLLRFIQERQFERVGEPRTRTADVRIVAATNKDLDVEVKAGRFREDLLYRLDVVHLHLPPLRERREDVPALVEHFAAIHARGGARPVVTDEAMGRLVAYDWPGNVRQLENVVARALALNGTGVLGPADFSAPIGDAPKKLAGLAADMPTLAELNRRYAQHVLTMVGGNKSEAARLLEVDRKTLYKLLETAPAEEGGEAVAAEKAPVRPAGS